jgi:hypothetical protein
MGALMPSLQTPVTAETGGGLMNLMMRDLFSGQVPGQGHGMQDNVYMPIVAETSRKSGRYTCC